MCKILIADDHQMFIDGLRAVLQSNTKFPVVAEANNGEEVLTLLHKVKVDVILLDVNMPRMNGITALKSIKEQFPHIKVIMLTMHNTRDYIERLLKLGADGYILKNTGKEELTEGIETVMKGGTFYSKEVTEIVMRSMQGKKEEPGMAGQVDLTEREKDVLKLIVKEHTTQEIAEKLFISANTVETHRKNLISKLGVRNLAGLVKYALMNNYGD